MAAPATTAPRAGRWWVLAALVAAGIALIAVIAEVSTDEGGGDELVIEGINESQRTFGGLPQLGDRLGSSNAPVAVQIFTDLQCGSCRDQFLATVPALADGPVRAGEVKLLYRHYSFSRLAVEEGFIAAEAAGRQGYQWQYAYLFFRNQAEAEQGGVTANFLESIAASVGEMEEDEWERDFLEGGGPEGAITEQLTEQDQIARELGLRAEPSAIVSGPGGAETLQDSPSLEQIEAAISRVG